MIPVGSKIGVSELFYTHVGVYLGDGRVFHHHWRNGTEIISWKKFADGKKVKVLTQGADDVVSLFQRIEQLLSLKKAYHAFRFNCEHAASFVREGVSASPQLAFYGVLSIFAASTIAFTRFSK